MPGFDRTGPQGAGPRTGRGMGYCNSIYQDDVVNQDKGFRGEFGIGRRGAGRGWRYRNFASGTPRWVTSMPEQEITDLKAQSSRLEGQLDAIQKRIEELTAK